MEIAVWLTALIVVVLLVARLGERLGHSGPLLLTAVGFAVSFVPFVPDIEVSPELVLLGFLPPLLFAGAARLSLVDFRSEVRPILLLSIGLVVATALAVGFALTLVLPIPFPVALAVGAIVAPPDAVAAVAIGRRIGLPRRVVTVLEGESLVNDATALVLLRLALAAAATQVTGWEVLGNLALAAGGGVAVGLLAAVVVAWVQARIRHTATLAALSLVTPWIAYLPAEAVHASGVLSVVVAGLWLAHGPNDRLDSVARLSRTTNWATASHVLESTVFLLIGLELRAVVTGALANAANPLALLGTAAAALVTTLLVRPVWLWLTGPLLQPRVEKPDPEPWGWRQLVLLSWAGMRGVVTVAAALLLPPGLPYREELILIAMVVVLATLLGQGATLPWVARRLKVRGPDPRRDAMQEVEVLRLANRAGLDVLAGLRSNPAEAIPDLLAQELRSRARQVVDHAWEGVDHRATSVVETPSQAYRRVRLRMIEAERAEVQRLRDAHRADSEVIARVLASLDVEEMLLSRAQERLTLIGEAGPLPAEATIGHGCEHLDTMAARPEPRPRSEHCLDCDREGTTTVHLRMCLLCGNVGCCDSSTGRHARRHYEMTGHTVMRSAEPGQAWRWCYVDETSG